MCQEFWIFGVLIGIFVSVYHAQGTAIVRHKSDYYFGPFKEGNYNLSCGCGNLNNIVQSINRTVMNDIITQKVTFKTCSTVYPKEVCNLLSTCKSCTVHTDNCSTSVQGLRPSKTSSRCFKEFFHLTKHYFAETGVSDLESSEHRKERSLGTCLYPHNLQTSDVTCKKAARYVKCVQKCIDGYTLPGGVIWKLRCNRDENVWKPCAFKECEPYVDCTLTLKSPGSLDCYTSTTTSPATCYVKCDRYEDKMEVPRRGYECRGGTWSRPLPFCVKKGSSYG